MAYSTLTELFTAIAESIREKTGGSSTIPANNFPAEIAKIKTGSGVDISDATATAGDILAGKTAYGESGKITGTLKMATGQITLSAPVTNSFYTTITHNLGVVPAIIFVWVDSMPSFDSTTTYNVVSGYAINFASGLVPGVLTNKSAANCINSNDQAAGDTTAAGSTFCIADRITNTSFRLRTNGSSRCWASGAVIKWVVLALS